MQKAVRARTRQRAGCVDDAGFTLIEVVIALVLIVTVMTATAGFLIRGVSETRLCSQHRLWSGYEQKILPHSLRATTPLRERPPRATASLT